MVNQIGRSEHLMPESYINRFNKLRVPVKAQLQATNPASLPQRKIIPNTFFERFWVTRFVFQMLLNAINWNVDLYACI